MRSPQVVVVGIRGSRFAERISVWSTDLLISSDEAAALDGRPVKCRADWNACSGTALNMGSGQLRVVLRMDPVLSRFASAAEIQIDIDGRVFALPRLDSSFDLDNGFTAANPISARALRCSAAEGRILAVEELRRVHRDFAKGLVTKDEMLKTENRLAAFVSNNYRLCR